MQIALAVFVSGCNTFCSSCEKVEKAKREHKIAAILPYTNGMGFSVLMDQADAVKMKAPQSAEFKEMVEGLLAKEREQGKNHCQFGYEIRHMIHFKHSPTTIDIDCKVH